MSTGNPIMCGQSGFFGMHLRGTSGMTHRANRSDSANSRPIHPRWTSNCIAPSGAIKRPLPEAMDDIVFSFLPTTSACKVQDSSTPWNCYRTSERYHRLEVCRRACLLLLRDHSGAPSCIAQAARIAHRGNRCHGHDPSRTHVGAHTPRGPQDSYRRFHDRHGESCRGRLWAVLVSCGQLYRLSYQGVS